jgi:hypothetical protein
MHSRSIRDSGGPCQNMCTLGNARCCIGLQFAERPARSGDRRVDVRVECAAEMKPASNADGAR